MMEHLKEQVNLRDKKHLISIAVSVFIFMAIPLTVLTVLNYRGLNSKAATVTVTAEAENSALSGAVIVGSATNASGGKYLQFGGTIASNNFQPTTPYYATFFYPWSWNPNTDSSWSYWNDNGHSPPNNWFSNYLPDYDTTKFDPTNELYSSNNYNVFKWQISKLKEAKQEVAISSWWGQGHKTDTTFGKIVTDFMNRFDNPYPNLRWALYYEKEGNVVNGTSDPTVTDIQNDLNYIRTNYASQASMLKINGKPVIFVYGDANDGSGMASRWAQANANHDFYVVLKVYSGYAADPNQPDSWHQYAPAVRADSQGSYSYSVSPGFWKNGETTPRLGRDLTAFTSTVSAMVTSKATWRLTETWNEWGEGSSVEPGDQVVQVTSGTATLDPNGVPFKNQYIDVLNKLLPALP